MDEERIKEIIKSLESIGLKAKRWTKNGNDRIYVKGFHYSKEYYIDLVKMQVKGNRPGTYSDIREHFGKCVITEFTEVM